LGLSATYFETTNIQFWIADYLMNVTATPYELIVFMFTLVSFTGPFLGALLSGYVGAKIGGYTSVWALPICIVATALIAAAAAPIPITENAHVIFALIWLMFFLGGLAVPLLTGVMLSEVEAEFRPQANSLANTMYNLLGYFPAPFVYGWICDNTGGAKSKWGMIFTLAMGVPVCILLIFSLIYKPGHYEYWQERRK
jgi:MFS family permease